MSIETMAHVLNLDVGDSTRKLVLIGYANHAGKDGTGARPVIETVAGYANCSKRTVQRAVTALLEGGFMREGDQQLVAHYPKHVRPVVYDVAMSDEVRALWAAGASEGNSTRARASAHGAKGVEAKAKTAAVDATPVGMQGDSPDSEGGDNLTPGRGDNLSPGHEGQGGDTHVTRGVTPMTEGGDTHVTQTVLQPSKQPSTNPLVNADALTGDDGTLTLISEEVVTPAGPQPSFEDFWALYPRKVGKQAARKAWDKWVREASPSAIVDGARRFASDPNLPTGADAGYVPHPATWLNDGRWSDETPLPPRGGRGRSYNDVETWGALENRPGPEEPLTEEELDRMFGGPAAAHGG